MYCKECGNRIDDDSKFCQKCGKEQISIGTNLEALSDSDFLIPFRKGSKWGFSRFGRKIVIDCIYDSVSFFNHDRLLGLAKVRLNEKVGFIDVQGNAIIPCMYDKIIYQTDKFLGVVKNNKYGLINNLGKSFIECVYDGLYLVNEKHIAVKKNMKWGLIQLDGKVVFDFIYDSRFYEMRKDLFEVMKDTKWGLIQLDGKVVFDFIYDKRFDEMGYDLLRAHLDEKNGLISLKGGIIIPYDGGHQAIHRFNESGIACFRKNWKWGLVNYKGELITPIKYDDFNEHTASDLFCVRLGTKRGYIDRKGNEVIPCIYEHIDSGFQNTLAWVELNGKYGALNKEGEVVIPITFDDDRTVKAEIQRLIRTKDEIEQASYIKGSPKLKFLFNNNKMGIIDKHENVIVPCIYDDINRFYIGYSEGMIDVEYEGKIGFVNTEGVLVIKCVYEKAYEFAEGLAAVYFNNGWGFIDKMGNNVIANKYGYNDEDYYYQDYYNEIEHLCFNNGIAEIYFEDNIGYIDKDGLEYWERD